MGLSSLGISKSFFVSLDKYKDREPTTNYTLQPTGDVSENWGRRRRRSELLSSSKKVEYTLKNMADMAFKSTSPKFNVTFF